MAKYNLLIDPVNERLIQSFFSKQPAASPTFVFGDNAQISITAVEENTGADNAERPWRLIDMDGKQFRVAIGTLERKPDAGEWSLLASSNMSYDADASEVETALNADATVTSEGGVTVTSAEGSGIYTVTYNTTGTKTELTETVNTLVPTSDIYVTTKIEGDGSTNKVVSIRLETAVSAYSELTANIATPTLSVSQIRNGNAVTGVGEVQRVTVDGTAYSGTYSLAIDGVGAGEISYDADETEIQTAIATHPLIAGDTDLVSVVGSAQDFTVTFDSSLGDLSSITADDSNLSGLNGKTGELNLNTVEISELLGGSATESAFLEIELLDTPENQNETLYRGQVSVREDIIPSSPPATTGIPTYAPAVHTHDVDDLVWSGGVSQDASFTGELTSDNDLSQDDHVINVGQANDRYTGAPELSLAGWTYGETSDPQALDLSVLGVPFSSVSQAVLFELEMYGGRNISAELGRFWSRKYLVQFRGGATTGIEYVELENINGSFHQGDDQPTVTLTADGADLMIDVVDASGGFPGGDIYLCQGIVKQLVS